MWSAAMSFYRIAVEREAVALSDLGLPLDAKPAEIFAHGGGEVGARTLWVEVLVAQPKLPGGGSLEGNPEGAGVADVQQAGGRWREPTNVGCRVWKQSHGVEFAWRFAGQRRLRYSRA